MSDDNLFGPADEDEARERFRDDRDVLFKALAEVIDERDLEPEELVLLLIEAVYHHRALAYVISVEKPSEAGFRIDLDRLRKLIDEMHRDYRKNAGTVVRGFSAAVAEIVERGRDGNDEQQEDASAETGR